MPSLGSDMERAVLIEWLVQPGEQVRRGDVIAVVETDKGAIEIEVFEDGYIGAFLAGIDDEVEVGAPLAEIVSDVAPVQSQTVSSQTVSSQEAPSREPPPQPQTAAPEPRDQPTVSSPIHPQPAPPATDLRASPAARRLAESLGVALSQVNGTGPEGAIVLADVERQHTHSPAEAAMDIPAPSAEPDRRTHAEGSGISPGIALQGMRRAIAAAMTRAKREIPHYYLGHTFDVETAMAWLTGANADREPGARLLAGVMLVKATALALRDFPEFNGFFEDGVYRASPQIHTGIAIAIRGGGLVAPAIHDTDGLPLDVLMQQLRDLTTRVRAGRFRGSELRDPTVTISNLGDRGVESLYGVIYPPQVACVGFGKVVLRPWCAPSGAIESRHVVTATLSADHRISDGHTGARFLATIDKLLQTPEELAEVRSQAQAKEEILS